MRQSPIFRLLPAVILATILSAPAALAKPPEGKGKGGEASFDIDAGLSASISAGISIGDARRIASNYQLTGAKPLPPGIRKNLARGKPMPPGIARQQLPQGFVTQLPAHEGYEWQRAGPDLVLVASGSLVINDILEGVFD